MEINAHQLIPILESSQVAESRRMASRLAQLQGFSEKDVERIELVTTEIATNLTKHTTEGGWLLVQGLRSGAQSAMELFAIDKGPGMDLSRCMVDGYSSSKTLGTGLGSVQRLADAFRAYSSAKSGSILHARFFVEDGDSKSFRAKKEQFAPNQAASKNKLTLTGLSAENVLFASQLIAGINVPLSGQQVSGDSWVVQVHQDWLYCMVVDGLGHGIEAFEASALAVKRFKENLNLRPADMLKALHLALRGSRGAVALVARINPAKNILQYAGLGNIIGSVWSNSGTKHLVSLNGTLGYESRKITEMELPWHRESNLLMCSDGFQTRTCDEIELLATLPASIAAANLYLHKAKTTDDASILIVKQSYDD